MEFIKELIDGLSPDPGLALHEIEAERELEIVALRFAREQRVRLLRTWQKNWVGPGPR